MVIEKLIGSGYISEYSKREFRVRYLKNIKNVSSKNSDSKINNSDEKNFFNHPYNELLIWAVLMKRHQMAMFACKQGEEVMAKALFAAKLNKSLAYEAGLNNLDSDISELMLNAK